MRELILFIASIIVSGVVIPTGIIWNIVTSIKRTCKLRFWEGIGHFLMYWILVFFQIWSAIKYILYHLAIGFDLMWNATSGEMLEDLVTKEEDTYFGKGNVTISAAVGRQEVRGKLNKRGRGFSRFLDRLFKEKNHCINAWRKFEDNG